MSPPGHDDGHAWFRGRAGSGVLDIRHGDDALAALDTQGFWAVVWTFEGEVIAVRLNRSKAEVGQKEWTPPTGAWTSSMDQEQYEHAVRATRDLIRQGKVYQANICRVLSAPLADDADLDALYTLLSQDNPAPHAARIHCPAASLDIASASPELFLAIHDGRITTRPIKGTATTAEAMLDKDHAENVMIVDLMRNDLSRICEVGTVATPQLCAIEEHPGLVHLVSTVSGQLRAGVTWRDIHAASSPAGSVSGAPKSAALQAITDLEPVERGPYCGGIGWVDADTREAELAVGIRTFWAENTSAGRELQFGTGAGITWGSDPSGEWQETELKARRLIALANGDRP